MMPAKTVDATPIHGCSAATSRVTVCVMRCLSSSFVRILFFSLGEAMPSDFVWISTWQVLSSVSTGRSQQQVSDVSGCAEHDRWGSKGTEFAQSGFTTVEVSHVWVVIGGMMFGSESSIDRVKAGAVRFAVQKGLHFTDRKRYIPPGYTVDVPCPTGGTNMYTRLV